MMRHNYETAVREALKTLVIDATGDGPNDVNTLADALHAYAWKLDEMRKGMKVSEVMRCSDCGRYWSTEVTVERARSLPSNCPTCHNASLPELRAEAAKLYPGQDFMLPQPSCYVDYHYLTPEELAAYLAE